MKWIDVSMTLSARQAAWPGDDKFTYWETGTIAEGNRSNCASMSLSTHFGTHIDAPYHFVPEGKTVDQLPPDQLIGPCEVISCEDVEGSLIEPSHLQERMPQGTKRLLVKTRNSAFVEDHTFHEKFTTFSVDAAAFLVERGVMLLGLDYFSIGPYKNPAPVHRTFLGSGAVAIENLILTHVDPGSYTICCLPLKIEGSAGAPARVVLGPPPE